ncbi:MAG: hypothetical protein ACE37F_06060 [Nannocystaceae bacterium]|nr:hypothetical protein [bacterium]
MSVTRQERAGRRLAACLGLLGATLVWLVCPQPLERDEAVEHATAHLCGPVRSTSLSLDGRQWTVCTDDTCALLDGHSGALIQLDRACPTRQP